MKPIAAFGEVLIDLLSVDSKHYIANPGGAPANVAAAAALLGVPSFFIGKVGRDAFGASIRRKLTEVGVNTDYLLEASDKRTTLAIVTLAEEGQRDFAFYRKDTADLCMASEEIPLELLDEAGIFHFGSLTLTAEPARTTTLLAAREAGRRGCLVSYDPNLRLNLWDSEQQAKSAILEAMELADLVKINEEELCFLTDTDFNGAPSLTHETRAQYLSSRCGLKALVVTLGAEGCFSVTARGVEKFQGMTVQAVDTTGAGDAFVGALLSRIARELPSPHEWTDWLEAPGNWTLAVKAAVRYSASSTESYGAIDSYVSAPFLSMEEDR
ncbi:carbohydrate kinase family protein [Cohnella herbarum]|uniref:Carbohydrate kinase n=1 Tax=Cohnella herbarum TaxID=2728023 RepID=A0A7Z2ZNL2_9BACL|nr:carbohydrate kinase [Cohnella herbarum]QJD86194.1 carbohydrate kinase [Cohnella herbarum]